MSIRKARTRFTYVTLRNSLELNTRDSKLRYGCYDVSLQLGSGQAKKCQVWLIARIITSIFGGFYPISIDRDKKLIRKARTRFTYEPFFMTRISIKSIDHHNAKSEINFCK